MREYLGDSEGFGPAYASPADEGFVPKYVARCYCGAVCFEFCADPVDAKICHCRTCQTLHGAPMQWAAIFHKSDVRLAAGLTELRFFNSELNVLLPIPVGCFPKPESDDLVSFVTHRSKRRLVGIENDTIGTKDGKKSDGMIQDSL